MNFLEAMTIAKNAKWFVDANGKASFGVFDKKEYVIYEVILLMKSQCLLIQRYDLTRFKKEEVYKRKVHPSLLQSLCKKGNRLFVKQVVRFYHV